VGGGASGPAPIALAPERQAKMKRFSIVVLATALACVVVVQCAFAHDRESNNGVTMTLHINPDDEPIATQPALLVIEKVETKSSFSWKKCRCTMTISDSSGKVIRSGSVGAKTVFTFPVDGAYQIVYAGRVQQKGTWRAFKISYAFRADPPG
jgi:hypothetical protein